MRLFLLLICVTFFTSAHAQFQIDKHLEKKQELELKKNDKRKVRQKKFAPISICDGSGWGTPKNPTTLWKRRYSLYSNHSYFPEEQKFNNILNGSTELPLPNKLQELLEKY